MHHQASGPTKLRPFLWQRTHEEIRAPIDADSAYEDIEPSTALVQMTAALETPATRWTEAARRPSCATPFGVRGPRADLPDPDFGGRAPGSFLEGRAMMSRGMAS